MISSDHDSDSDVESVSTGLSVAHVVFTPTKRPPSPGTSDEDEDFYVCNKSVVKTVCVVNIITTCQHVIQSGRLLGRLLVLNSDTIFSYTEEC